MSFFNKLKDYLDKGVEVSKDAFSKAGGAVHDFGDKSVVLIEKKQFENKYEHEISNLGKQVNSIFTENQSDTLTATDARISGILAEISRIKKEIEIRQEEVAINSEKSEKKE